MVVFIINWLASALAIVLSSYLLPGVRVDSFSTAFIAAAVLGILNALVRPLLLLLTLPINILTLGLFTLVINAIVVLLVAYFVPGFQVDGLLWAIIFGIVLGIINSLFSALD